MRKWEATLRRDENAWADFKQWLNEQDAFAIQTILSQGNTERAIGVVNGIRQIIVAATANEREEQARARTS